MRVDTMRSSEPGFTLVEVLIALAIVAVALGAAIRATGAIASNDAALRAKALAVVAAENHLTWLRISGDFPAPGRTVVPCSQGPQKMQCEQTVSTSVNSNFRQVTLRVYPDQDRSTTLVSITGIVGRILP